MALAVGRVTNERYAMKRKTFDIILTVVGFVLAIVLAIAGGLLLYGGNFATTQVHDQLAAQQIFFPPAGSDALKPDTIGPYLNQYAGQQLTTGAQAEAYANHFIAVHLQEIGGGKTYSQLSAEAMANPNDQKLAGQVATLFKGETLRGLLLNAYAFSIFGQIATIAGWVSIIAAIILLILSIFGWIHAARVPSDAELGGAKPAAAEPTPVA